jgi:hypothetical protein
MRKPAAAKTTSAAPAKRAATAAAKPNAKPDAKAALKADARPALKKAAAKPAPAAARPAVKSASSTAARAVKKAAPAPKAARKAAAKPAAAAAAPDASIETVREKARKAKLVRDSFTMPEHEYEVIGQVKKACLKAGFEIKKSELLRIGVALISQLDLATLQNVLASLPQLKTGRPKKA